MTLGPTGSARFERCSFRDVRLREWLWGDVELVGCTFSGVLSDAVIRGTSNTVGGHAERRLTIVDNDFSDLEFDGVGFSGRVDLTRQRLPRDPRHVYIADARDVLPLVRAAVATWTDSDLRWDAEGILKTVQFDVDGGQTQLLFDPRGFGKEVRSAGERLADLLVVHGGTRQSA